MSNVNFPGGLDNGTTLPYPGATDDTNSPSLSSGQSNQNDAVIAVETKLGTGASNQSPLLNQALLGTGTGTSAWGNITGSYMESITGSGDFVLADAPTLTSATLDTAIINNPTLNTDSVVGFTTSNTGTVYGLSITGGVLAANTVGTTQIQANAVGAAQINFGGNGTGIWWQEIARNTLAVAGDTMIVSGITAKNYLRVSIATLASGGTINLLLTFNGDTTSNYAVNRIEVSTGGSVTGAAAASASNLSLSAATSAGNKFYIVDILNLSTTEKAVVSAENDMGAVGASNVPTYRVQSGKWSNTSTQITTITATNGGSGNFAIGSELIVLGHN
jgi:hypothetical protein